MSWPTFWPAPPPLNYASPNRFVLVANRLRLAASYVQCDDYVDLFASVTVALDHVRSRRCITAGDASLDNALASPPNPNSPMAPPPTHSAPESTSRASARTR